MEFLSESERLALAERKRQMVSKRIVRREMERNPTRKFFKRTKPSVSVEFSPHTLYIASR